MFLPSPCFREEYLPVLVVVFPAFLLILPVRSGYN